MDPKAEILQLSRKAIDGCFVKVDDDSPPIVSCARHKALAIDAALEALAENEEAALMWLESTRDAAIAAGRHAEELAPVFGSRAGEVRSTAAAKRAALQAEAIAADIALECALDTTAALIKVRL